MDLKHFSHHHGLSFHQTPETTREVVICSGCKSPASSSGSLYSCRQCNFFLHEQCFNAARSMNHTSHPSHPLTLFPYPTYPSNSFFCNFCNLSGTGFSYSCSSCEFDLHVHCAYTPDNTAFGSIFGSLTPQYTFPNEMAPSSNVSTGQLYPPNPPYAYTPEAISHQSVISSPNPSHASPNHLLPNTNMSGHPIAPIQPKTGLLTQHSIHQRIPQSIAYDSNINGLDQQRAEAQHVPSHTSKPYHVAEVSNPAPTQILPPPNKDLQSSNLQADVHQARNLKHFSHHHALRLSNVEEEDYILCSACEQHLSGSAYRCTKPKCDFHLHKPCFELSQEIHHKSHPEHSLVLLSAPPYKENGEFTCNACSLTGTAFDYHCKVCQFDLHVKCATLAENVKREDHEHPLKLLFSSPYKKEEDLVFSCDVCHSIAEEDCWVYYCHECDFGTHFDCVMADRQDPEEETEQPSEAHSLLAAQMQLQQIQLRVQLNQQAISCKRKWNFDLLKWKLIITRRLSKQPVEQNREP